MRTRRFKQVDVFTDTAYLGNALAVVLDGDGLSDEAMQRFARWTNLSETTFLLPPTEAAADYRVRIFTPGGELPFAGHPTLGSCHAWLEAGGQPHTAGHVVQQCAVGLVTIQRELQHNAPRPERLTFAAPPLRRSQAEPALLDARGYVVHRLHLCGDAHGAAPLPWRKGCRPTRPHLPCSRHTR